MDEFYFKRIMSTIILIVLVALAFFLLKPILLSIVFGIILAFVFTPLYRWVNKYIKSENISAFLVCSLLVLVIVIPLWFLTPTLIDQSIKIFMASQETDFIEPLKSVFPSLFDSEELSAEIGQITHSFVTKMTNSLMNYLSGFILNFPTLFLQSLVVFFTFFYILRDQERFKEYIKSLLPFSRETERELFKSSKAITYSVIYGQVVIGIIQGLVVGLSFFIFGVPNALILTLLACLAGILPVIGTTIVWLPVSIYLFIVGNNFSAFGVVIFGLISSTLDNFIRPVIVSRRTKMNSSIVLIGMIGGLLLFGVLGFILGPLILAYLLIILDIYRNRRVSGVFYMHEE